MTRRAAAFGTAVLFLSLAVPGAAQNEERYKVRLSMVPMDIPMRSTVTGLGAATAVLKGAMLTVNGTFEGLVSAATTARVHRGVAMGVRGASFADLTVSKAQKGTISGSINLAPDQIQALRKGQLYLQISSEKAPDGNLWGWFVR
jgi:hypothetical protein